MPDEIELRTKRLRNELLACFAVVDSCLDSYYNGNTHMYRPIAGQLRILLCDKSPLLTRVFPNIEFQLLKPIEYLPLDEASLFDNNDARLGVSGKNGEEYRLAKMPFLITQISNGLQIADIELLNDSPLLRLDDWVNQLISFHPCDLSIIQIVKSVADKGGGAHVDNTPDEPLKRMQETGPAGIGFHKLFIIALSRFIQKLGLCIIQFGERQGFEGSLADIINDFDISHASVINRAKVHEALINQERSEYALTVLMRIK